VTLVLALDIERGSAIESVLENGGDVPVRTRADSECASARRLDALGAVLLREPEHRGTSGNRARVAALSEQSLGEQPRVDAYGAAQPRIRSGVHSACIRWALGMCSVMVVCRPTTPTARVCCHAAPSR